MPPTDKSSGKSGSAGVIVVAPTGDEGAGLVRLVNEATRAAWPCRHLLPAEVTKNPGALASAGAVVVSSDIARDDGVARALAGDVPVIACGAAPPPRNVTSASASAWIRKPTPALLRLLLDDALASVPPTGAPLPPPAAVPHVSSPPPSGAMWRRKSDMIIGRSPAIRQVLDTLDRVASSSAAVSVTGESGTGKELVARALHYTSARASKPFIALNCAAIPEPLFEAELFGYVRGAFTGAVATRVGAFEAAHEGTLFLDEIGEMPRTLQPKLLRVLERGDVTRLGSNESRKVTVRVVAATNRALEDEVRAGNFRQDLYYRLHVCHVHVPPLRERIEDIAPLVAHHLSILAAREQRATTPRLSSAAFEKLLAHSWPGNVRELLNVLEAAVLLAPAGVIDADHLQLGGGVRAPGIVGDSAEPPILAYRDAKARFDAEYYERVLRAARGNVSLASKLAQKTRKEIYEALRRANLDADSYRDDELPNEG